MKLANYNSLKEWESRPNLDNPVMVLFCIQQSALCQGYKTDFPRIVGRYGINMATVELDENDSETINQLKKEYGGHGFFPIFSLFVKGKKVWLIEEDFHEEDVFFQENVFLGNILTKIQQNMIKVYSNR